MERIAIEDILAPLSAQLLRGDEKAQFTGVSIDSRAIKKGDLFFPFAGKNCDAHRFIIDALNNGAIASIAQKDWIIPNNFPENKALLLVDSVPLALQNLATYYRQYINPPYLIGITGSTGKTTTKDLVAGVVKQKFQTLKTQGNYNNDIGVPLTIFGLTKEHQVAVIELGMRGLGEIKELTDMISPNIGIITNVGETHLELLGTKENIALAKSELVEAIPADGTVVLNADNSHVKNMANKATARVIFYGLSKEADVWAQDIVSHGERGMDFTLVMGEEKVQIELPLLGLHNVYNALAAAAIGKVLNLSLSEIKKGLETVELTGMRLEIIDNRAGVKIINDAYNASPASMAGALRILSDLAKRRSGKSIAILGNMYELGEEEKTSHRQMGELATKLGVNLLVAVGELASFIAQGALESGMEPEQVIVCSSNGEVEKKLPKLESGDTILVKGSRSMKMEEIVDIFRSDC